MYKTVYRIFLIIVTISYILLSFIEPQNSRGMTSVSNISSVVSFDTEYIKIGERYLPLIEENYEHNETKLNSKVVHYPLEYMYEYLKPNASEEEHEEILRQVREISDEVVIGCEDDYAKIKALAKWVAYNVYYDKDAAATNVDISTISIDHILNTRRTTCAGYSNMLSILCASQGYSTISMKGGAVQGTPYSEIANLPTNHEWLGVYVDDEIVLIDVTWMSSNYYTNNVKYTGKRIRFEYFDMRLNYFSIEHRIHVTENRGFYDMYVIMDSKSAVT